jgi:hypothetical protein
VVSRRRKAADQLGGAHEVYPTPEWCVHRLLDVFQPWGSRWFEPCVGEGAIIDAACSHVSGIGLDVQWVTNDARAVVPHKYSIVHTSEDVRGIGDRGHDVLITNPPYSLSEDIVRACLPMARTVIMLLPMPFHGSGGRASLIAEHRPSAIYQLPDRPIFAGTGSNSVEYGWFVWHADAPKLPYSPLYMLPTTPKEQRRAKRPTWIDAPILDAVEETA